MIVSENTQVIEIVNNNHVLVDMISHSNTLNKRLVEKEEPNTQVFDCKEGIKLTITRNSRRPSFFTVSFLVPNMNVLENNNVTYTNISWFVDNIFDGKNVVPVLDGVVRVAHGYNGDGSHNYMNYPLTNLYGAEDFENTYNVMSKQDVDTMEKCVEALMDLNK